MIAYLALSVLPLAFLFGFSLNPTEFAWAIRHGFEAMPEELSSRAAAFKRYANFLGDALILSFVFALMSRYSIPPARVGLHFENWRANAVMGIVVGALLLVLQGLAARSFPHGKSNPLTNHFRKGSVLLWFLIFVAGSFSEELWIAICLVTLIAVGHSAVFSVAITTVVFAAVHYGHGFGGALAVAAKGTISAALFLHYESLIPTFLFHFIGNLGSFYWARLPPEEMR